MVLDAASLEAITQEIRTCFLYEDAPDQLSVLEQGIRQLQATDPEVNLSGLYSTMLRAAHSLKGGAGIAQFTTLSRLSHHLEDLLQALQHERVEQQELAYELISLSIEQIGSLIVTAIGNPEGVDRLEATTLLPTTTAIENFLQSLPPSPRAEATGDEFLLLNSQTFNPSAPHPPTDSQLLNDSLAIASGIRSLNLKIPVSRLERIDNTIGELFISYERLSLYQEQLHQVDLTLKQRAAQLNPLSEDMQALYNQLAVLGRKSRGKRAEGAQGAEGAIQNSKFKIQNSKLIPNSDFRVPNSAHAPLNYQLLTTDYQIPTSNSLQELQELIVQVQEARADVEFISLEMREALVELRQQLDDLRGDLTESRLVKFGSLANQFAAAQQSFSQRYGKSVQLAIEGRETTIDRAILEQLKIPLLHLFRNAFDHGIESASERQASGKSPIARMSLIAVTEGNQLIITLADDGRGIDLTAVRQRAEALGLCDSTAVLSSEQILEFLFRSGFSTSTTVTTLSGRGLGLDIVRLQVERLRGTIGVETTAGQGTKFTISIPMSLNILPLLLCKCQQQTLAFPASQVKEVVVLSEYGTGLQHGSTIAWRNLPARLYYLPQFLPYQWRRGAITSLSFANATELDQRLGLVLEIEAETVVLAVDQMLGERELVLKPFDATVKVPNYLLGCTVLGTGEIVPVLSPDRFQELLSQFSVAPATIRQESSRQETFSATTEEIPKILIVDDAIAFRRILERILTAAGYKVVQCRDGQEALEKLSSSEERFDLAISDLEMPRVDGLSLLREIRASSQWQKLPVIVLTSRENQWHRQTAFGLGATEYFTKPFCTDDLLQAIANLLPVTTL
ncbi:MAG: Sensor histidine kinase RcsC [Chroococcidiopsis cubana SAG 39.79]|jgi:chemotaxis protein histidine kinase CheA/ActR/RegA family two-component response regulator|uniref:histidine kinase n=1 Tax=Chroococcidiopsis cubana SAG 39.79 TaxID=388085 RepID=A0AB37UJ58_9CYAN|nr:MULTISPECIES: response regulator [Chroococcidiopsis]MDZ4876301.1 Sensor histidine kinase RcsC [Chroococcidiopsis cubana SAG 39.79]PSB62424.1 hybrid sensor histidine kinase/response regulator [Chroococcidiopsis cubana CCALA 043]RUT11437.1 two-component hybrid sensor & regulator [Chroococcidiopsis cubana SAG 39.79]URD49543.1 response regulator [Chroococcidiopsis sp. CCNUC1]